MMNRNYGPNVLKIYRASVPVFRVARAAYCFKHSSETVPIVIRISRALNVNKNLSSFIYDTNGIAAAG
jgi:hypothetical protein